MTDSSRTKEEKKPFENFEQYKAANENSFYPFQPGDSQVPYLENRLFWAFHAGKLCGEAKADQELRKAQQGARWVKASEETLPPEKPVVELIVRWFVNDKFRQIRTMTANQLRDKIKTFWAEDYYFLDESPTQRVWPTKEEIDKASEENIKWRDKDAELFDFYFRMGIEWLTKHLTQKENNTKG